MSRETAIARPKFLAGGGAMGRRIWEINWAGTELGDASAWPPVLQTAISILLQAPLPSLLCWGSNQRFFYNDAFAALASDSLNLLGIPAGELLGSDALALRQALEDEVPDEAAINASLLRLLKSDTTAIRFRASLVFDESQKAAGMLLTGHTPATPAPAAGTGKQQNLLAESPDSVARLRSLLMQAPVGIVYLKGPEFVVEMANDAYLQLIDRTGDYFIGKPLFETLPEVQAAVEPLLNGVMQSGHPYFGNEFEVTINRSGKPERTFFNFVYQPIQEVDGVISGVLVIASDVSKQVEAKLALEEREKKFSRLVMQSPIAMTIFRGPDFVIETANQILMEKIWRKKPAEVIGKKALDLFPELNDQKYADLLRKVLNEGITHRETEALAFVQGNDGMQKFYLDFEYQPLFENADEASGIIITVNDVTERVVARQQLELAEERLRAAVEGTGMATWDRDLRTGQIVYSPQMLEIFGYRPAEAPVYQQLRGQVLAEDIENVVEPAFQQACISGNYFYEARIKRTDGKIRWLSMRGRMLFDENGEPYRMLGTTIDITDQKEFELHTQQLAAIVQTSEDAIISKRIDGIVTSWNEAATQVFGYLPEEMIGQTVLRLIPPDKHYEEHNIIEKLKRGERIAHFESHRLTKDGRLIDVSLSISPLKDSTGKVIGASKIARDITRQKQAERRINESEQKFRILADSMPQMVWTCAPDGTMTYVNKTVIEFTGTLPVKSNLNAMFGFIHPQDRVESMTQWLQAIKTGTPFLVEHRFLRNDGEYRWQLSRALPQKDQEGRIQMWVGTSTDINEIKVHDQQKDDFIKMASHELKTPVTTIKGYVQLLLKMNSGGKDPFLSRALATIDRQVEKLTKLVTDLLDVTKIETGSFELNRESFAIGDLIREIADELETTIQTHRIRINEDANPMVFADRDRLAQVFVNLFTNAIKYSPKANEILVNLDVKGNDVLIDVRDYGIGIGPEDRERIFERFYRVAGKDEKTFPGFGIGLFIVSEIMRQHHGRIWVSSAREKGSIFHLILPANN